jgi:type IV secretion system protein VirB9
MCRLSLLLALLSIFLTGCALKRYPINNQEVNQEKYQRAISETQSNHYDESQYNPSNFQVPNHKDSVAVLTSQSFGDNPVLLKAYQRYLATGQATNIQGKGIETLAYNQYDMPLITCSPLQLCQIILAKGEMINDITTGDPTRWQISSSYVGNKKEGTGSWVVQLKPSQDKIATDLTITTDARIYRFAISSKAGVSSQTINFWYPHKTLNYVTDQAQMKFDHKQKAVNKVVSDQSFNINHLHMNYSFTSPNNPKPAWLPENVFDDGQKTYIKLPIVSNSLPLPIFLVSINSKDAIVNYRYKKPYIIYDGLFKKAMLVSGKGDEQLKVNLINNAYPQK